MRGRSWAIHPYQPEGALAFLELAIVRAVIGLGHSLDVPFLAEGVETKAQHALLLQEGCNEVQGYLMG